MDMESCECSSALKNIFASAIEHSGKILKKPETGWFLGRRTDGDGEF